MLSNSQGAAIDASPVGISTVTGHGLTSRLTAAVTIPARH